MFYPTTINSVLATFHGGWEIYCPKMDSSTLKPTASFDSGHSNCNSQQMSLHYFF
jgi:hypothetical protein